MQELKPCPFCGGELRISRVSGGEDSWKGIHHCKIVGSIEMLFFPDEETIAKLWNTRHNDIRESGEE